MTNVIKWTEIQSFHNVRKFATAYPNILKGKSTITYLPKVKLHGTNAAIQMLSDGTLVPQSRTQALSVTNDNAGFAKYVEDNKEKWNLKSNYVVFGEWAGPSVQKGVAVSTIPNKEFFVFAIRDVNDPEFIVTNPAQISLILSNNQVIIPWASTKALEINWLDTDENLQKQVDEINEFVDAVEKVDPLIKSLYGIEGTGEGLVWYPTDPELASYTDFSNLVFKTKGEKHRVVKADNAAQVKPQVAEGVSQFVDMFVTEARLEQGAQAVSKNSGFDMKFVGSFISWMNTDIEKESKDELAAANLSFKDVQKEIIAASKKWYMSKVTGR